MSQSPLTLVPNETTKTSKLDGVLKGLAELDAAIREHMMFNQMQVIGIERNHTGEGLMVSFIVRGSEEARDASIHLRRLPGYNVAYTATSPAGMRHKVMGYIK